MDSRAHARSGILVLVALMVAALSSSTEASSFHCQSAPFDADVVEREPFRPRRSPLEVGLVHALPPLHPQPISSTSTAKGSASHSHVVLHPHSTPKAHLHSLHQLHGHLVAHSATLLPAHPPVAAHVLHHVVVVGGWGVGADAGGRGAGHGFFAALQPFALKRKR